jgi:outer membrane protein OmpA-like peptidoglycan-associated protein
MRPRLVNTALLTAGLLALAAPAGAQGYFELGGFGTYAKFDPTLPFGTKNSGGARLSFASGSGIATFILEGDASYFDLGAPAPSKMVLIPARARLLYAPTFGAVSILVGGGAVHNDYRITGPTPGGMREWGYSGLAGFRIAMGNYMSLRVDGVIDYITHPYPHTGATPLRTTNRSVQAGLAFPLWSQRPEPKPEPRPEPKPVVAVAVPAPAPTPEPAKPTALPDTDNDGVPDGRDQCAGTPPGTPVDLGGCPAYRDSDNDGVVDSKDACPATPGNEPVDGRGCTASAPRDTDQDGIPDTRDRCPSTAMGTAVNSIGCAPEPVAAPAPAPAPAPLFKNNERTVTLRGVNFETAKDDLTGGSMAILDDVARQLNEAPTIKVEIGGHTDASGPYTRNVNLSLRRAEAVRAYLVMQGVAADRLVARGYGPAKPAGTNATPSGRAMNRRVELKRID